MRKALLPLVLVALILSVSGLAGPTTVSLAATSQSFAPSAQGLLAPAHVGCFAAALSVAAEILPHASSDRGYGTFVLSPDRETLNYEIHEEGVVAAETGAHIHLAAPGSHGDIVFPLPAGSPKGGSITLGDGDLADLLAGLLYVNIHSGTYPGGEIRGQMVPSACWLYMPIIMR